MSVRALRAGVVLAVLFAGVSTPGLRGVAEQQAPVFRSGAEGVTVQVSVLRSNRPVGGLTDQDFALLDNGVPQTLTTFAQQQFPIDLTLLLDLSSSVDGQL